MMTGRKRVVFRLTRVRPSAAAMLRGGGFCWPVLVGANGLAPLRREGDGSTPVALLTPLCVLYRGDRTPRPRSCLPTRPLRPDDGYGDAPADPSYNRFVRHPHGAGAERLWRQDHAYDIVVVLDFNVLPRRRGAGSAIFLHLMHEDARPTAGCIAMHEPHLRQWLRILPCGESAIMVSSGVAPDPRRLTEAANRSRRRFRP